MSQKLTAAGYAVLAYGIDGRTGQKEWEPMDYGIAPEPHPEMLLKRGRIGLFETASKAETALEKTLEEAKEMGAPWATSFKFVVLPAIWRTPPEAE